MEVQSIELKNNHNHNHKINHSRIFTLLRAYTCGVKAMPEVLSLSVIVIPLTEIRGTDPNIMIFQVPQPVRILLILHIKGANYDQVGSNPNLSHYDLPNSSMLL